jgi:hypothetical protein
MTYREIIDNRPQKTEIAAQIWFNPNNPFTPLEVIDEINKALKKIEPKNYTSVWVVPSSDEDEYGNTIPDGIIIMGTRLSTNEEWIEELNHIKHMTTAELENHKKRMAYFETGWVSQMRDLNKRLEELSKK